MTDQPRSQQKIIDKSILGSTIACETLCNSMLYRLLSLVDNSLIKGVFLQTDFVPKLSKFFVEFSVIWVKSTTNPDGVSWGQFKPYSGNTPHKCWEYVHKLAEICWHDGRNRRLETDMLGNFNRKAPGLAVPLKDQKNRKRFKSCGDGLRCRGDVWCVPHVPRRNLKHPCPFPPKLAELALRGMNVGPGDVVLDPFCGIGSTGVAAVGLGAHFIGIDLNPDFCKIGDQRIREIK